MKRSFYNKILTELENLQNALNSLRETVKEEIQGEKQAHE